MRARSGAEEECPTGPKVSHELAKDDLSTRTTVINDDRVRGNVESRNRVIGRSQPVSGTVPTTSNTLPEWQIPTIRFQIHCLEILTTWAIQFDFYLILPLEFFQLLECLQLRTIQQEQLPPLQNESGTRLIQFYAAQCLSELESNYPGELEMFVGHSDSVYITDDPIRSWIHSCPHSYYSLLRLFNPPFFMNVSISGLLAKWIPNNPHISGSLHSDQTLSQSVGQSVIYQSLHCLSMCCLCQRPNPLITNSCCCGIYTLVLQCYSLFDPSFRPYVPIQKTRSASRSMSQSLATGVPRVPLLLSSLAAVAHPYHSGLIGLILKVLQSIINSFLQETLSPSLQQHDNNDCQLDPNIISAAGESPSDRPPVSH